MTARDPLHLYYDSMQARGLTKGLIQRRYSLLRTVELFVGESMTKMTAPELQRWIIAERKRVSAATVYCYIRHVTAFYNWALEERLVKRNPSRRLAADRPHYLPRPLGEDKLADAIESAEPRARVILALAAYAGLRAIEIARLSRADIIESNVPPVLAVHGKGDRLRVVPLPPRLLEELKTYGMPARGPLIRRLDDGQGHVSSSLVSSVANAHLHSLGFSDTLHSCRHRYGTRIYGLSKDLRLTQELLGHASPATTSCYTAWAREDAAVVAAGL